MRISSENRRRSFGANVALRNAPMPTASTTRPKCQAGAAGLPRTSSPRTMPVDAPAARPAASMGTPSSPPLNSNASRNVVKPTTALNTPMAAAAALIPFWRSAAISPALARPAATRTVGTLHPMARVIR